jgi:molybdate transport system substrate-binding protein
MKKKIYLIILLSLFICQPSLAKTNINIAAASDMKFALEELKNLYLKKNVEVDIGITTGSSGKFYEQIINGAPFDLFFSADIELPGKLKNSGIGDEVIPYAIGRIVLWSIKDKVLEFVDLKNPKFKKIAIANPIHAPYGERAISALKKSGIYNFVKDRLVFGENISQTAQFIETGAADIGIVAISIVMAPNLKGKGSYIIISDKLYSPLVQGFTVVKKDNKAALDFKKFMTSPMAKEILTKYGFETSGI